MTNEYIYHELEETKVVPLRLTVKVPSPKVPPVQRLKFIEMINCFVLDWQQVLINDQCFMKRSFLDKLRNIVVPMRHLRRCMTAQLYCPAWYQLNGPLRVGIECDK